MDKDDNLFEDEIKENIDLLDIGLDDLTDNTGEATGEGDDEGVIELTDLLEKGGAELFEEDEILKDDIRFTDDLVGFSDDLIETETDKKGGFDDLLLEADISAPADDLGLNLTEEGPDELLRTKICRMIPARLLQIQTLQVIYLKNCLRILCLMS